MAYREPPKQYDRIDARIDVDRVVDADDVDDVVGAGDGDDGIVGRDVDDFIAGLEFMRFHVSRGRPNVQNPPRYLGHRLPR